MFYRYKHTLYIFATAQLTIGTDPVYSMFQFRNYLSNSDCTTSLATATAKVRNCSAGANVAQKNAYIP